MTWAKDARNVVEKEGDLDMHSQLAASVVFSHLPSEDQIVTTPRPFLLQADINKIAKLTKSKLPAGVADAAVLRIERRWVANCLPKHELVWALTYVYSSLYRVCNKLAVHLGGELDATVPDPTGLDPVSNDVARVRFIKLGKPNVGRMKTVSFARDPNYQPPHGLIALREEFDAMPAPKSLDDIVTRSARLAEFTFTHHGNHVPMLFLFDEDWKQIDFLSTAFTDQTDKFLFWRNAANRASYLKAAAIVWISESWLRDRSKGDELPIREMPIIGERLHVIGAAFSGEIKVIEWSISRAEGVDRPVLKPVPAEAPKQDLEKIFFIKPMLEAMRAVRPNCAG